MAWIVLIFSAMLEAVWATALGASEGFTRPVPTIIFLACLPVSMWTLAFVAKSIPMGTAYAIWAGLGGVFTVVMAALLGLEALTLPKALFMAGILACVVALKLTDAKPPEPSSVSSNPYKIQVGQDREAAEYALYDPQD